MLKQREDWIMLAICFVLCGADLYSRSWISLVVCLSVSCGIAARAIAGQPMMLKAPIGELYQKFRTGKIAPLKGFPLALDRAGNLLFLVAIGMLIYRWTN